MVWLLCNTPSLVFSTTQHFHCTRHTHRPHTFTRWWQHHMVHLEPYAHADHTSGAGVFSPLNPFLSNRTTPLGSYSEAGTALRAALHSFSVPSHTPLQTAQTAHGGYWSGVKCFIHTAANPSATSMNLFFNKQAVAKQILCLRLAEQP